MHRTVPTKRLAGVLLTNRGLTHAQVSARREEYGPNDIIAVSTKGWVALWLETVRDPMLWFLLATAILFFFLGNHSEALILVIAMVPLIGMDLYLHRRTQASTEGLASRLATQAKVKRADEVTEIAATELVPGDLILVSAGQSIPADGIIIQGESLQLDESALTGEAYPVRKQERTVLDGGLPQVSVDVVHWVYAGTRLLTGSAQVRLVYTGAETLYGEIVRSVIHGKHERTPLQSAIANLVGVLLIAATILCLVLAWVRLRQGFGLVDAVLSAVTLAVAALPEEFPVVFTFFLGVGVFRLAQRRALVRRAVVVENIGRVSCICSDKTGTITEGQLQLTHQYPAAGASEATLLTVAAMASRMETGDPMDTAILRLATVPVTGSELLATFPFTEDRKRETAVWRESDDMQYVVCKGAPEIILALCDLDDALGAQWRQQVDALAAEGHKVIACAAHRLPSANWTGGEPDRAFGLIGLLAFEDPVRQGVTESIRNCQQGGIHVVMVTGDHPATARAVANEIGLGQGTPNVLEADHLEGLLQRGEVDIRHVDVIARAIPAQKLSLVRNLQASGEVVAVTGDGVNDVPALQAADIGLAMGERGTRSARDVAAIVLLDDNFSTITRAIAEGRQLFRNLKLSFAYLLMIHIPLVLTAALIPLVGYPLLYLPVHIVWLELVIHPTALLVFQALPTSERLSPVPRTQRLHFFNRQEWLIITCVGVMVTLMIIIGYERSLGVGREVEHARAMTLVTLSFASAFLTMILSRLSSRISRIMVLATICSTLLLVQVPWLAAMLHLKSLHTDDLLLSTLGAVLVALLAGLGRFARQS